MEKKLNVIHYIKINFKIKQSNKVENMSPFLISLTHAQQIFYWTSFLLSPSIILQMPRVFQRWRRRRRSLRRDYLLSRCVSKV